VVVSISVWKVFVGWYVWELTWGICPFAHVYRLFEIEGKITTQMSIEKQILSP
jgi:hypothetical protein